MVAFDQDIGECSAIGGVEQLDTRPDNGKHLNPHHPGDTLPA
jgi:hypothetical protein